MKFNIVSCLFALCFLFTPVFSTAAILLSEESIDINSDVVVLSTTIDQKSADAVILRIHQLQMMNKSSPIYFLIDSGGGEIVEGGRIIDAMNASKRPVFTVVVGSAGSMAAFVHSYGVKRFMLPNSELMYHNTSWSFAGEVTKMVSRANHLTRIQRELNNNIVSRSNVTIEELMVRESDEWWVGSQEAIARGLVDDTIISTAFIFSSDTVTENDKDPFPFWPKLPKIKIK